MMGKLTPYRVLRSFVTLMPLVGTPAEAPKPAEDLPDGPKAAVRDRPDATRQ